MLQSKLASVAAIFKANALRFHKSLRKNGENILKGEYPKEEIKYEVGMKPLCPLRHSYACNFLHMISTCTYT